MSRIKNYFSYIPREFIVAIVAMSILVLPAIVLASWSPARPTFTIDSPADYVTFNSITDNPNYGDERTFHDVKDASNTASGGFADTMQVEDGQELLLRAYVHNNAAANLDLDATNTRVSFLIPSGTSTNMRTISYVSADNATPQVVSDTVDLYADEAFQLEYVAGSAVQYTNAVPSGITLDDSIVTNGGALIGYNQADGIVTGCFEYSSIVTIKVKVKMPELTIEKTVRELGTTEWTDNLTGINPGDTLQYRIKLVNSGSTNLDDVTVGDNLPPYVSYVDGSAMVYDGAGTRAIGDNLTTGGVVLSPTYAPGASIFVVFEAIVDEMQERCGNVTLTNVAIANSELTSNIQDNAVTVVDTERPCTQEISYTCDSLTVSPLDRLNHEFTGTATVEGDDVFIDEFVFDFGDGNSETVTFNKSFNTVTETVEYAYSAAGTYDIVLTVNFDVDGEAKSETCTAQVSIEEEPETPVYTCSAVEATLLGGREVSLFVKASGLPEDMVTLTGYSYDFGDGNTLDTDKNKVTHTYASDGKYNIDVAVHFDVTEDGETVAKDVNCGTMVQFTPDTPPELPNTGAGSIFAALFGTSSLTVAVRNWLRSRKALNFIG